MIPGLSIIVPTLARPSLAATLDSILTQTSNLDQVVVVFDGTDLDMEPTMDRLRDATCDWAVCRTENLGSYGHPARNYALEHAVERPWLLSIDDDDAYLPGAFDAIREAIAAVAPAVHVFGCQWGPGHPAHGVRLPHGPTIRVGNIGTPMVVAPVCTARFGSSYMGDYDYVHDLWVIFGEFVWHPDTVIAEVRPVAEPVSA